MTVQISAVLAGLFAVLELFGISIPDDVKLVISDNTNIVLAGVFTLIATYPKIKAAFDAVRKPK